MRGDLDLRVKQQSLTGFDVKLTLMGSWSILIFHNNWKLLLLKLSEIIIWTLISALIATHQLRRRSIATPGPPDAGTLTAIKLLPLATVEFGVYWRSTINPHLMRLRAVSTAFGTAELMSVNGCRSPFGRIWSKSFHVFEFIYIKTAGNYGKSIIAKTPQNSQS